MPDEVVAPEASTVAEEAEFEAAFAEFAAGPNADSDDPDNPKPSDDPKDEPDAKKADESVTSTGKEGSDAESGKDAAARKEGDPEDKAPDRYAGLSDEDREYFKSLEEKASKADDLQHRIDSDAGRVSAFQRKINGLETEIQSIRKGGPAGQPDMDEITEAMKGSDAEWDQFAQDYPQVAGAIDRRLEHAGKATQDAVGKTLAPVVDSQERIVTNEATAAVEKRVAAVAEVYPTWTEEVQTTEFKLWLDDQPPGVNALAESDDVKDAIALFDRYDQHLVAGGGQSLKPDPGPGVDKEAENPEAGAKQSELEKKRAQQLEDGVSATSKPAGVGGDTPAPDEFEAAFNAFAARKERARA